MKIGWALTGGAITLCVFIGFLNVYAFATTLKIAIEAGIVDNTSIIIVTLLTVTIAGLMLFLGIKRIIKK